MKKIDSYTFLNFSYIEEDVKGNKKLTEDFKEKYNALNTAQLFLIEMFPSKTFNIQKDKYKEGDNTHVKYSLNCEKLTMEDVVAINAYLQIYLKRTCGDEYFGEQTVNDAECEQVVELLEYEFGVEKLERNKKLQAEFKIVDNEIKKIKQGINQNWPNLETDYDADCIFIAQKTLGRCVFTVNAPLVDNVVMAQNFIIENIWDDYSKEIDQINIIPGLNAALFDVIQDVDEFEKRFNV